MKLAFIKLSSGIEPETYHLRSDCSTD